MTEHPRTMRCPKCGGEMNHHADKLVLALGDEDATSTDPAFGGVIQEAHGCPGCGYVELRQATPARS